ncbi:armadillo-type protein, partial [Hysterangium stoloniferum]
KSSDQQASIFLQQKLKIADVAERKKIVDAVSQRGVEMMMNRFGNWAVQRCLEPPCELADRMKIVQCMRGHVVELATNCYGTHVLQKALDCEEDIRLLIVSELLLGDPSSTLLNKHSAHVWSKIMELTWTSPAPPIFAYVNKSLAGKWASLACHETGSLVVQTAFEQCEEADKELIIGELLDEEAFTDVVTNAWGNFCILHLLEHGSPHHRALAIDNLVNGLSQYASHEQSIKSVLKALKEGGPEVLDKVVTRLCEPPKGGRRASLVDISLSPIGSQLVGTILPNVNKDQRSALYEAIRGHVVTLRGSRVGSKVIWLFDRMRAYYGY